MVDRAVEQAFESETERDGAGTGHAGADDLHLFGRIRRTGSVLAHLEATVMPWRILIPSIRNLRR